MRLFGIWLVVLAGVVNHGIFERRLQQAQENPVKCETHIISPPENSAWINTNGVITTPDGQVIYLIERQDTPVEEYDLIHVSSDQVVTHLGAVNTFSRVYRFPIWHFDSASNTIFYQRVYQAEDGYYHFNLESIHILTGERTTLVTDIWDLGFGTVGNFVWANRNTNEIDGAEEAILVDMTTREQTVFTHNFADNMFFVPQRILSPTEAIFMISLKSGGGLQYLYANSETRSSQLLHTDFMDDFAIILDDRIAYINTEGIYKEVDFQGQILREIPLSPATHFNRLVKIQHGMIYAADTGIYVIPNEGAPIQLTSDQLLQSGDSPDIQVTMGADGSEYIWFSAFAVTNMEPGTFYTFRLSQAEELIAQQMLAMENTGDFDLSPNQHFAIVDQDRQAVLVSTQTFERVTTLAHPHSFYNYGEFSQAEDRLFFIAPDGVYAYDFEQATTQRLAAGEFWRLWINHEDEILYLTAPTPQALAVYAVPFAGAPPVQVSLPDVRIESTTHTWAVRTNEADDLMYIDRDWQTLYLAQCEQSQP